MDNHQIQALQSIAKGIIESASLSPTGAPSGVIYAALMGHGASLNQFQSIMDTLVKCQFLTHDNECHTYHATDSGIAWTKKVGA